MERQIRLVMAIALVAALGCKKDQSATGDDAKEAMGLYAKGFNALLKDGNHMVDEYFQTIPKEGPDLKSKPRLFPDSFATSSIKEAREAFDKAGGSTPKSLAALPPIATKVIAAVDKVNTTYGEAQKYYEGERYKDDGGSKAKELHAAMLAASKEFKAAMGEMGDALSGIEDAQAQDEIAKFEGAKDYSYWFRFYNQQAKKFVDVAEKATDPAKVHAAFAPVAAAYKGLGEFVKAKGSEMSTAFGSYAGMADSFDAAAAKLLRAADDKHSLDTPEVSSAFQELVNAYNSLVSSANGLYQVEGAGGLKS